MAEHMNTEMMSEGTWYTVTYVCKQGGIHAQQVTIIKIKE